MSVGTGSKVKSGKYLALAIEIKVKNIGCCIRHCQYQRGYIGLCLLGVGSILAAAASVMIALKIICGLFLVYLAARSIRAAKCHYSRIYVSDLDISSQTTFVKEFVTGFLSGILNPRNLLYLLSVFPFFLIVM